MNVKISNAVGVEAPAMVNTLQLAIMSKTIQ
jgi:hypothetical protein